MDILAGLNIAQREAVEAIDGPVLILAGPGSGKTRVITHRVAYLIKVCGVSPRHILAVTFTNKAAREMKDRLNKLCGSHIKELTVGTFHSICARILRIDGEAVGVSPRFVIYDEDDQIDVLKRSIQEAGFDPKQYAPRSIAAAIRSAKARVISPKEYTHHGRSYFEEVVQRVYECYQRLLTDSNALDFDDLLMKTVLLMRRHPDVAGRYQKRYQYVQVDEFQDTNLVQYELVRHLGAGSHNVCVVGDPDQSIYAWRFADLRNILHFEKDYPDARVVLLEQNYRSTKRILDTASRLIKANSRRKHKGLWTDNDEGESPQVVETYTEQEEAQYVVGEIESLVRRGEVSLADCAVMFRTNAQSRVLEEAFIRYGLSYKLVSGTRFYERREVKDIIAYLRIIQNPSDLVSLGRIINVPQRGIGQQSMAKLSIWAQSLGVSQYDALGMLGGGEDVEHPFNPRILRALTDFAALIKDLVEQGGRLGLVALLDKVLDASGYKKYLLAQVGGEERWDNVLELRTLAQQYNDMPPPEGLAAFLEGVTLVSDVDGLDESAEGVTLITLHQAKGLEFPVVFIVGMEDGILPHFKTFDEPVQMEEERRLCYVGITRAKRRVYLVRAFRRSLMGSTVVNKPSRFLDDIPTKLCPVSAARDLKGRSAGVPVTPAKRESSTPRKPAAPPLAPLKDGSHVRHVTFGEGVVVRSQPSGDDVEVVVAFGEVGLKKLLMRYARLEQVD